MLFPTITFALFFTVVFTLVWIARGHQSARKYILLGASYLFYGWWDWRFCLLLLGASLTAWLAGILLGKVETEQQRKTVVAVAVVMLLAVLSFFKYYGFFLSSLQDLLFAVGWQRDLPFLQIVLPVGISFFTFQAISYVVDVYRGEVRARDGTAKGCVDVLLYVSLFPQLVAGPIVRAADFLPQLERPPVLTKLTVSNGLALCLFGLFKKMVVANYLANDIVDPVFLDPGSYSSLMLLLAVYGYAVQIYCDFSGYTDIAIGTALLLGFQFKNNFNQPYRAQSLQDFWRRWHISLSHWLRDYLYIPLGGSRFGTWKTYRNLFLTMLLGGLWHGAAWKFIIWGALHGAWLGAERALGIKEKKHSWAGKFLGWLITFNIVCVAWIFFRSTNMELAGEMFSGLAAFNGSVGELTWFTLAIIFVPLAFQFGPRDLALTIGKWFAGCSIVMVGSGFIAGLLVIVWLSPPGTAPFIYFQF